MVIFGATGDLMRRKLMPALYNLYREHLLPAGFSIVGVSRTEMSTEQFRAAMKKAIQEFDEEGAHDESAWESFAEGLSYLTAQTDQPNHYRELAKELERVDHERGTGSNRLFYLAVPPSSILEIVRQLDAAKLARSPQGWTRIIIEKPFGHDLDSARELNERISRVFDEDQIYRIDHYLGKETVQNLMVFRFANVIFEPIWNRRYVDHVQITNAEAIGVEGRGGYYDTAGVLRDMIQNHVFQVLSLVAMEPPINLGANAVRDEKIKAMQAVRPIPRDRVDEFVVRGQYAAGAVAGKPAVSYREEKDVPPNSQTDTFTALKLYFDNWRWAEVPFYLRSGQRMPKRVTDIAIQF